MTFVWLILAIFWTVIAVRMVSDGDRGPGALAFVTAFLFLVAAVLGAA